MGNSGKSVDKDIPPTSTPKEHAKKEADGEWECSLAKIMESMGNSGESVDENTSFVGTPKEHAKTASNSYQEFSLTGNKETIAGVSKECSDVTGETMIPMTVKAVLWRRNMSLENLQMVLVYIMQMKAYTLYQVCQL